MASEAEFLNKVFRLKRKTSAPSPKLITLIEVHRTWIFYGDADIHKSPEIHTLFSSALSTVLFGFIGAGSKVGVKKTHHLGLP